jgi:hypothetical protein
MRRPTRERPQRSRLACDGWVGTGSVPASGTSNRVDVTLTEDSLLDWQWSTQYALTQTGTPAGILSTTTWWFRGRRRANDRDARQRRCQRGQLYLCPVAGGQPSLAGCVQPDLQSGDGHHHDHLRTAVAVYMPTYQDSDGDDMPTGGNTISSARSPPGGMTMPTKTASPMSGNSATAPTRAIRCRCRRRPASFTRH